MRRAARIVAILGAACVAACFGKPDAPHIDDGGHVDTPGEGDPDARGLDAFVPLTCPRDEFDNPAITGCETWGNLTTSGVAPIMVQRPSGQLMMNFNSGGETATCTTKTPMPSAKGTSIQLTGLPPGGGITYSFTTAGKTTTFTAHRAMANVNFLLDCDGPDNHLMNPSLSAPQWMQFKVMNSGSSITVSFEMSIDGSAWNPYPDTCTYIVPYSPAAMVSIGADSGSGAGSAYWDHFNSANCP